MAEVYGKDSYLMTDDDCYEIELLDMNNREPEKTKAYLFGDFYYLYRGDKTQYELDRSPGLKPGIYRIKDKGNMILRVDPITAEEMEYYKFSDKIGSIEPRKIVDAINTNNEIIIKIPEYKKTSFQNIDKNDDLLKRLIKTAFNKKGVGVDDCEHGFADKNARFNFKQAVSGPNRLSMMYFERGCDALGLEMVITLKEKSPDNPVGAPLDEGGITMSSEDTYDL